jgi:hypothetical protein
MHPLLSIVFGKEDALFIALNIILGKHSTVEL